jgi:Flp pilus assembly protein protease CpaA
MVFMEKSNWVVLIVGLPMLVIYGAVVVPQLMDRPIAEVDWVGPMVAAILGFVVANVLGNVVAAATNPREADRHDERDREIDRFGERIGNWLVAAGAVVALILAMVMAHQFWIANAIFLAGIAGSLLGSAVKIAAYRGSFQRW